MIALLRFIAFNLSLEYPYGCYADKTLIMTCTVYIVPLPLHLTLPYPSPAPPRSRQPTHRLHATLPTPKHQSRAVQVEVSRTHQTAEQRCYYQRLQSLTDN